MLAVEIFREGAHTVDAFIDDAGIVIDRIAEGVAQRHGAGVVVECLHRLVGISSIEGDAFIDKSIAIPVAISSVLVRRFLVASCRGVI